MAASPVESEFLLRHELAELARRRQELGVAQAELMSAGGTRRTYLKAGALFFARAPQVTKQAVAGHLSAIEDRRKAVSAALDRLSLNRELERQDLEDEQEEADDEDVEEDG